MEHFATNCTSSSYKKEKQNHSIKQTAAGKKKKRKGKHLRKSTKKEVDLEGALQTAPCTWKRP